MNKPSVKPIMGEPFDVTKIEDEVANLVQGSHDPLGSWAGQKRLSGGEEHSLDSSGTPPGPQDNPSVLAEDPINPSHYRKHPSGIECIEITRHMNNNIGNAIKYLWRYMDKDDPVDNLKKAQWYIDDEIRRLQGMR